MGAQSAQRKDAFNISCGVELNGLSLARQGSRLLQPLSALCRDLAQSEGWPCPAARVQSITHPRYGGLGLGHCFGPGPWGRAEVWQQELFKLHLHGNVHFFSFFRTC